MLPTLLAPLLLAIAPAVAEPASYPMSDVGATLILPSGWGQGTWSDWDFKAASPDGSVHFFLWMTPFQAEITPEAAAAWGELYREDLAKENFADIQVSKTSVETVAGRATARARLTFRLDGGKGAEGVFHAAAFQGAGHVIHVRAVASERNEKRAVAAIDDVLSQIHLDKEPLPTGGAEVSTEAGFAATLPPGWRAPLAPELDAVLQITAKLGQEKLAPETCWVAIRPPPVGDPDVIFACSTYLYLGPVDEHSFEGVEAEVHDRFFGRVETPVPVAEKVQVGDRLGFYFRPPRETQPLRLAVAPYGQGDIIQMWGLGNHLDAAGLDEAMMSLLGTVTFTGPDGGKPMIGADRWISYYLKYRPFSPVVLGPVVAVLALVGALAFRKKKPKFEIDE